MESFTYDKFLKIGRELGELKGYLEGVELNHFSSKVDILRDGFVKDFNDSVDRLLWRMEELGKHPRYKDDSDFDSKMTKLVGKIRGCDRYVGNPFNHWDSSVREIVAQSGIDISSCGLTDKELEHLYWVEMNRQKGIAKRREKLRRRSESLEGIRYSDFATTFIKRARNYVWGKRHFKKTLVRDYLSLLKLPNRITRRVATDRSQRLCDSATFQTKYSPDWSSLEGVNEVFSYQGIVFCKVDYSFKSYTWNSVSEDDMFLAKLDKTGEVSHFLKRESFKGWIALGPNYSNKVSMDDYFYAPHPETVNCSGSTSIAYFKVVAMREMGRFTVKSLHDFVKAVVSRKGEIIKEDLEESYDEVVSAICSDYPIPPKDLDFTVQFLQKNLFDVYHHWDNVPSVNCFIERFCIHTGYDISEDESFIQDGVKLYTELVKGITPLLGIKPWKS